MVIVVQCDLLHCISPRKIEFHQCLWILGSVIGVLLCPEYKCGWKPTRGPQPGLVVSPYSILKNLFLCKLPIKNCIKWNQWLKVNCSIIKFIKSQTLFRIEITNDSWKFIISIPDSYHVSARFLDFGPGPWISVPVRGFRIQSMDTWPGAWSD